jgi:hypothetical protein
MEKLQQLLNFSSSDGEVITFFDGKVTLSQLVMAIVVILIIGFAIKVLKGVVRTVIIIVSICIGLVHYGIASPTQIKDAASVVAEKGIGAYKTVASASENIRISGTKLEVKLGDNWFDVSDVTSYVQSSDSSITVYADGNSYIVDDISVINLLKTFK